MSIEKDYSSSYEELINLLPIVERLIEGWDDLVFFQMEELKILANHQDIDQEYLELALYEISADVSVSLKIVYERLNEIITAKLKDYKERND